MTIRYRGFKDCRALWLIPAALTLSIAGQAEVQSVTFATLPTVTVTGNFNGTGTLNQDDDIQLFAFASGHSFEAFKTSVRGCGPVLPAYLMGASALADTEAAASGACDTGTSGTGNLSPAGCLDSTYISTAVAAGECIMALTRNLDVPDSPGAAVRYGDGFSPYGITEGAAFSALNCAAGPDGSGCAPAATMNGISFGTEIALPEPSTIWLVTGGLAVLATGRRRQLSKRP